MITEAQRRALFALREALHLCEVSSIALKLDEDNGIVVEINRSASWPCFQDVNEADIGRLIAEYPEATA